MKEELVKEAAQKTKHRPRKGNGLKKKKIQVVIS